MPAKMLPDFTASNFERGFIKTIAERAVKMAEEMGVKYDMTSALMDIEACHCNGSPLALDKLATADGGTFGHDVFGIRRHLDRKTGKLGDCFVPRLALKD